MKAPVRLDEILAQVRARTALLAPPPALRDRREKDGLGPPRPFAEALRASGRGSVIAEVKRAAPSAGVFEGVEPCEIAQAYARAGAACLSILADPHFGMTPEEFPAVRRAGNLPSLWKDFILEEIQIDQAYGLGADAVLLIARLHEREGLERLLRYADELGMESLVEIHEASEAARLPTGVRLVGANARDLADPAYATDPARLAAIRPHLPPNALSVAESGFSGAEEVRRAFAGGPYDAFLVGTSLLRAHLAGEDLAARISALCAAARA